MAKSTKSAGARVAAGIEDGALAVVSGAGPRVRRAGIRSWSKEKEAAFLSLLAETCNVSLAAAGADLSASAVYERRRRNGGFRAAWATAIANAYHKLELILLDRALNGTEKIVRVNGRDEKMREYPNQLALALLKMHRDTAVEAEADVPPDEVAAIRARLLGKLERLQRRERSADAGQDGETGQ